MIASQTYLLALPEIVLLSMINIVLLVEVFFAKYLAKVSYYLSQLTLILVLAALWHNMSSESAIIFNGMLNIDPLSHLLKMVMSLMCFFVFLYSRDYIKLKGILYGEHFILTLFSLLGMFVLVSSAHLMSAYLGLELIALPIYTLIALDRDNTFASEASMKYFVLGALASALLLYGMSVLYGVTGKLAFTEIANQLNTLPANQLILSLISFAFILIGIAFKFGAVPFHMWLPDVYQGAPTSATLFISSVPKIAAVGFSYRIFMQLLPQLTPIFEPVLITVAVLSIALGNLVAIAQTNIRRMLAYSTIAHVGFMFLGLLTGTQMNYSAVFFYVIAYVLMTLSAFGLITLMSKPHDELEQIDSLAGLNARHPWFAFLLLICMFSLAGVPPTVGFYAKLFIIKNLVDMHLIPLAVFAVIFSFIGAYYYLRVVKTMYFDKSKITTSLQIGYDTQLAISLNALLLVGLGILPGVLFSLITNLFK